jgi:hypothetical protein
VTYGRGLDWMVGFIDIYTPLGTAGNWPTALSLFPHYTVHYTEPRSVTTRLSYGTDSFKLKLRSHVWGFTVF